MKVQPRLILVCGLPGSGKTTLAKAIETKSRAVRFCADEWMEALSVNLHDEAARERIEALQWSITQKLLALGLTVIIEWGTWTRGEREKLRDGGRALGAGVELHYLAASPEMLFQRIQRRGAEQPPIERAALYRWFEVFEEPTSEEMKLFDEPLL
jgi:predicted kinase